MSDQRSLLDTLHEATHRVPGVPAHVNRAAGNQGNSPHGRMPHASIVTRRSPGRTSNHSPARPPRVLAAWQRRIAAFFGQEL